MGRRSRVRLPGPVPGGRRGGCPRCFVGGPPAAGRDHRVAAERGVVPGELENGGPAGHAADLVQQPDPGMRLVPVNRTGQLAAQDQATVHILSGPCRRMAGRSPDGRRRAPRIALPRCRAMPPTCRCAGASQDRELVRHRSGLDIIQHVGPESQVMRGPPLQDRVVSGPRGRVLATGDRPLPGVGVRESLATLIISHALMFT